MKTTSSFDETPFPLVMMEVLRTGFSGIIFASSGRWRKGIIFKDGGICAIQSNRTDELLGNILVDMGAISADENERALAKSRSERRKQGVILMEMGSVKPPKIAEALKVQIERRFLDIFSWEDGTTHTVPKDEIGKDARIGRNEMSRLVTTGVMEYSPFSAVITSLSPFADATPKVLVESPPGDLGIDLEDIGRYRVSEILLLGQDPSRALLALYCRGDVSFEESRYRELIGTLRQKLKTIKDQDPFQALGVDRQITDGGLKRAYIRVVKANHPDTYAYADDPEVRRLANEVFTEIQRAYSAVNKIREGKPPEEPRGIDESLQAEILYTKGTEHLRTKDYQKAVDCFKMCMKLNPDERLFVESFVKTLFLRLQNTGTGSPMEIKTAIREGLNRFPGSDALWLIYGWVLKREGSRKALEAFRKALEINRGNMEAQREIRLYQMRENR
jgi:tetratricopeptide (TPR) repeat protein